MGKGIGKLNKYIYIIKKGAIIIEFLFSVLLSKNLIKKTLVAASRKLPVATIIYYKRIKGV
jgi:ribosomal protein L16/L10AE